MSAKSEVGFVSIMLLLLSQSADSFCPCKHIAIGWCSWQLHGDSLLNYTKLSNSSCSYYCLSFSVRVMSTFKQIHCTCNLHLLQSFSSERSAHSAGLLLHLSLSDLISSPLSHRKKACLDISFESCSPETRALNLLTALTDHSFTKNATIPFPRYYLPVILMLFLFYLNQRLNQ